MLFVHQALTWGFLLALVPLLIHLINMLRHQRVQWAAMEFLLQSYRKHRQWIWLKQFLLLLARMLAVALVVAMLAHLTTRERWLRIFAGQTTHHYVLLDDSYSMSERTAGASAFENARQALQRIVDAAENADSPQRFTLIRYSRALPSSEQTGTAGAADVADFNSVPATTGLAAKVQDKFRVVDATELAVGPKGPLELVAQMLTDAPDETALVYVLSDFRRHDWESPTEVKEQLKTLAANKSEIHFIQCARPGEPNLGIVEMTPANDTRAADVPLFVDIKVKNFGSRPLTRVPLKIRTTYYPADDLATASPLDLKGVTEDVVTLLIDSLSPNETAVRRAQVYFAKPGKHVVQAQLPDDSIAVDNQHWCVIDFPAGERVLIVDGTADQQHAYFMEATFRPLERSSTGIRPEVRPAAFLRETPPEALNAYSAIYLLDVPRLDDRAVTNLQEYVEGGGGLGVFLGPEAQPEFYNRRLYDEGKGLLPMPVGFAYELPPESDTAAPDFELTNHPIFSFFVTSANSLVHGITVTNYRRPKDGWKLDGKEKTEGSAVIAKLRDGQPLMLEKAFGDGRVVCFTSTLAPTWNDWAKSPSFVVLLLKLQGYLASPQRLDDPRLVGSPITVTVDPNQYQTDLTFVTPAAKRDERMVISRGYSPAETNRVTSAIGRANAQGVRSGETDRSGVYEAWPIGIKGAVDLRRWAVNVEPEEGNLRLSDNQELLARLEPVTVQLHRAEDFQQESAATPGYNLSLWLLLVLLGLLIGEQALAYLASYHLVRGGAA